MNDEPKTENFPAISKLSAARSQLDMAIRLYFASEDPVSIHTLASASFALLDDIARHNGRDIEHFRKIMFERARAGMESKMRFYMKRHENFFKHADRDATELINFNPASTEWVLMDCITIYVALTSQNLPLHMAFSIWWQYTYRDLLKPEYRAMADRFEENREFFADRAKYLEVTLPIVAATLSAGS